MAAVAMAHAEEMIRALATKESMASSLHGKSLTVLQELALRG